jgi:hypothetical protein
VNRKLSLIAAGVVLGTVFAASAEAGDKRSRAGRNQVRQDDRYDRYDRDVRYNREVRDDRYDRYFRDRDVVVIREYYRPSYRTLPPGLQRRYVRSGYLPPGWARRMRPVPVYIERDMVRVPRGYRRGVIDGRAVVFDHRGFILDVAVLF